MYERLRGAVRAFSRSAPISHESSDVRAMLALGALSPHFVPWTSSAMRPSAVLMLCNEIALNKRATILEFGAGASTIFMASTLRLLGFGKVWSVESDANWILKMQEILAWHGASDFVEFVHAPLAPTRSVTASLPWHDESALDGSLEGLKFGLVVVDGPEAHSRSISQSRYPALPFLMARSLLAEEALVVLDDFRRSGERLVARRWKKELGAQFRFLPSLGVGVNGIARANTAWDR